MTINFWNSFERIQIFIYYRTNNIIEYIGKTTQLDERIKQHTKDKLKNFNGQIYYFECKNKTAMTSWEYSLINKYHPRYNAALKDKETREDQLSELDIRLKSLAPRKGKIEVDFRFDPGDANFAGSVARTENNEYLKMQAAATDLLSDPETAKLYKDVKVKKFIELLEYNIKSIWFQQSWFQMIH